MASISVRSPQGILEALVDDDDADLAALAWHMAGGKGKIGRYAATSSLRSDSQATAYMHRLIAQRMGLIGSQGTGEVRGKWRLSIDHINGDKLDNSRANLRLRDRSQQMMNRADGLRSTNTSGFRGVSHVAARGRKPWVASVTQDRRRITLGWFETAQEADAVRRSYDAAEDKAAWLADRQPRAVAASGHRGVLESRGRFYARVSEDRKLVTLGGYDTAEDAARARADYLAAEDKPAWLALVKSRPATNGTSGYRGVSFMAGAARRPWRAQASLDRKWIDLGRYDTVAEAAAARRAWDEKQVSTAS
jgi:hypothetical protein